MKVEGKEYCDVSRVHVAQISKSIAKDIIVKKHYTHAWTMCRYALGIYYKLDEEDVFGNKDKLIGCASIILVGLSYKNEKKYLLFGTNLLKKISKLTLDYYSFP